MKYLDMDIRRMTIKKVNLITVVMQIKKLLSVLPHAKMKVVRPSYAEIVARY